MIRSTMAPGRHDRRARWIGLACAALCLSLPALPAQADPEGTVQLARYGQPPSATAARHVLPRPLTADEVAQYRYIFMLQDRGAWAKADRLIRRLGNRGLMGHVLAQRYLHPTAYRSHYEELRAWLAKYADHPQAERIHDLALKRRPAGSPPPRPPVEARRGEAAQEIVFDLLENGEGRERTNGQDARVAKWEGEIRALVARDRPTAALGLLDRSAAARLASPVEYDRMRATIARGYYNNNKLIEALHLASLAATRSGHLDPALHWMAGLSAWRLERYEAAARHFTAMATGARAIPADVARAAFWAARSELVAGRPQRVNRLLQLAAGANGGFYGLLAQAMLGETPDFGWNQEGLSPAHLEVLLRDPSGRRALALGQVGMTGLAEAEIRGLAARANPQVLRALAALADKLDLPAAQMRVAQHLEALGGDRHVRALFPVPKWRPAGGFRLDRALVYAVMRAESGFNTGARSHKGALGLMQLMPETARDMARRLRLPFNGAQTLMQPATNLALGEAYLGHLLKTAAVSRSLIHAAVAYNLGPTRLTEWNARTDIGDDPLLFFESIPYRETRGYVRKVLTNLWAYRARLDQPMPSLEALASNRWPTYVDLDQGAVARARN